MILWSVILVLAHGQLDVSDMVVLKLSGNRRDLFLSENVLKTKSSIYIFQYRTKEQVVASCYLSLIFSRL